MDGILGQEAINFIILITAALFVLFADLFMWARGSQTFSQTIWKINQKTLILAFIAGLLVGHLFTVPGH